MPPSAAGEHGTPMCGGGPAGGRAGLVREAAGGEEGEEEAVAVTAEVAAAAPAAEVPAAWWLPCSSHARRLANGCHCVAAGARFERSGPAAASVTSGGSGTRALDRGVSAGADGASDEEVDEGEGGGWGHDGVTGMAGASVAAPHWGCDIHCGGRWCACAAASGPLTSAPPTTAAVSEVGTAAAPRPSAGDTRGVRPASASCASPPSPPLPSAEASPGARCVGNTGEPTPGGRAGA